MCWLIRLQELVNSRLFEAFADPGGGLGCMGGGGVCQTYMYFKQAISSRKGVVRGGPTLATILLEEGREDSNTTINT